eukprot:CAMPEP_0118651968 /NCGR_PEP_ID=MMETSP0785-20121206/11065_1 /TAXON_ID=91992 /ORGANISM="Bolidomonas pacifica, Strain CCMP 1866" /LENGTH=32 /DNA_ID= /DNA_START= /DNA_END= /DNA_ORIENTATION=
MASSRSMNLPELASVSVTPIEGVDGEKLRFTE